MATSGPTNLPAFFNTDQDFRDWVAGLHTAITAVGLVNTADTGQIDTATVVKPAGASTFQGYKIYRFADTLQASFPIYLKVEFGSASSVATRPAFRLTVGGGTNGAGTLTGQVGTALTGNAGGTKSAGITLPTYCSGTTSRLTLACNLDSSSNSFGIFMNVERSKDASGNDTADGVVTFVTGSVSGGGFQVIPPTGSVPTANTTNAGMGFASLAGQSTKAGTDVYIDLLNYGANGKAVAGVMCSYVHADIGELVTFTTTLLGSTHTMMPLGDGILHPTSGNYAFAIPWE